MPTSRLFVPPVTQDLWPVLRDRVATATMATILGGTGRVFVEGDYSGTPDLESKPWGRSVIVPVLPVGGIRWIPGLPTMQRFLFRTDFNNIEYGGLKASVWASRSAALAQREAARRLEGWDPGEVLISTQVMVASRVRLDEVWQPRVLFDPDATGTVFLSSSWLVDTASAAD
jgi:hypothetical protein